MITPEDFLEFVELKEFSQAWERFSLTDDDLYALQVIIMHDPLRAPVIPGTGGLRKLRFSPPASHQGKRGAFRICYAYFAQVSIVLLALIYGKSERDDLTDKEKKAIRGALSAIKKEYLK